MTGSSSDVPSCVSYSREGACVGIDDLSVYIPRLFLPTAGEFSDSRGIEPGKLLRGIGIERMAIPDVHEDAATMAAMSLRELMQRSGLRPEDIGKIYIGTESAVDEAKAIGTYVIGMMEQIFGRGSFQDCVTAEFKSACIGTTQALEALSYWVAADEEDKAGIVIATDVAKYPLGSAGEYTQGAGSISLLVKRDPRIIALDRVFGTFTKDENDFFRPMGQSTAVVNGKHSNQCYLDAMQCALDSFAKRASRKALIRPADGGCVTDLFDHLLFHIPFPRMVEYASAAILRHEWRGLPRWKEITLEVGAEPQATDFDSHEDYLAAEASFSRRFARSRHFQEVFTSKASDSAALSRQIGNIYTGSIYLGLTSLIEQQKIHAGERLLFGAYGSGCSALVFSGRVQPGASLVPLRGLDERLAQRLRITLKEYEELHEGRRTESIIAPSGEFALTEIDPQGYRHYELRA